MWLQYDLENIPYDESFKAMINYAQKHKMNNLQQVLLRGRNISGKNKISRGELNL